MHSRRIAVLIAVGGVVLSALAAWWLDRQGRRATAAAVERRADAVRHTIGSELELRLQAVEHLGQRWDFAGRPAHAEFEFEAANDVLTRPGYQAVSWVDRGGIVRWSVPTATNRAAIGMMVHDEPERSRTFRRAAATARLALSQTYPLAVGGRGIIGVVPVAGPSGADGFVAGVFRVQDLFDAILRDNLKGALGAWSGGIAVHEGARRIYPAVTAEASGDRPRASTTLDIAGARWRLEVWPNDAWLREMDSPAPEIAFGGGVLLSLLLAWGAFASRRASARIEDERTRLHAVLSQMPFAVIIGEAPSGRLVLCNDHVERTFGHPLTPVDGRGERLEWVGYHPDGRRLTPDEWPLAKAIARGETTLGQLVRYPRPGEPNAWIRLTAAPIRDRDGRVVAGVVATEDVTRHVATEEALRASEERFRSVFEEGGIAIALGGTDSRFLRANRALCELLGYTEAELLGLTTRDVTHQDDLEPALELTEQVLAGKRTGFQVEQRYVRKDGRSVWVLLTTTLVRDPAGAPQHFIAQMQDLSARKAAEELLTRQAQELQRSNEELEQFAYAASHDLQEPLRMVTSFTNLLERKYGGQLDDRAREYIAFATDGAGRMKRLIEDLLAYSRVGSHGRPFGEVAIDALLADIRRTLAVASSETGATIEIGPMPVAWGDATQIGQVFQNLLGNALKFRRPGTAPRVSITARDAGSAWQFSVRDDGIGFDAAYADRIFVMFQRLHTREEFPGTGIGLTLCKRIVERHGGRIWVDSSPGAGATFHFTISKPPTHVVERRASPSKPATAEHATL